MLLLDRPYFLRLVHICSLVQVGSLPDVRCAFHTVSAGVGELAKVHEGRLLDLLPFHHSARRLSPGAIRKLIERWRQGAYKRRVHEELSLLWADLEAQRSPGGYAAT